MATSSPSKMDAISDTIFFNSTCSVWSGRNMHAPAPQGPGFCLHDDADTINDGVLLTFLYHGADDVHSLGLLVIAHAINLKLTSLISAG